MFKNKLFIILWVSIGISILGSELAEFAIGLWVLKNTHSLIDYSLIYISLELPILLLAPLIGFIIDKYDKRKLLFAVEVCSGLLSLSMLLANSFGVLTPIYVYIYIALTGIFTTIQIDCYLILVYKIVKKENLSRANAMGSLTDSLPQLLSPILGTLIFYNLGLDVIFSIDITTFFISSLATLYLLRVPIFFINKSETITESNKINWKSILPSKKAVNYVRQNPLVKNLLLYSFFKNMAVSILFVTVVPFFVRYGLSENMVGEMMSFGGLAMVLISTLTSIYPNLSEKIPVLYQDLLFIIGIIMIPLNESYIGYSFAIFLAFFSLRLSLITLQTTWHKLVTGDLQGRVFAFKNLTKKVAYLISYLTVGFIIDFLSHKFQEHTYKIFYIGVGIIFGVVLSYYNLKFINQKTETNNIV